jgi:subtilisin-like proprotein convertase family protein
VYGVPTVRQILDGPQVTQSIFFTVSETGVAKDVRLHVRVDHSWISDVFLLLIHPDGTSMAAATWWTRNGFNPVEYGATNSEYHRVVLKALNGQLGYGTGCMDGDHTQPDCHPLVFSDSAPTSVSSQSGTFGALGTSYKPEVSFNMAFGGKNITGQWELVVRDSTPDDIGVVLFTQLSINTKPATNSSLQSIPAGTTTSAEGVDRLRHILIAIASVTSALLVTCVGLTLLVYMDHAHPQSHYEVSH